MQTVDDAEFAVPPHVVWTQWRPEMISLYVNERSMRRLGDNRSACERAESVTFRRPTDWHSVLGILTQLWLSLAPMLYIVHPLTETIYQSLTFSIQYESTLRLISQCHPDWSPSHSFHFIFTIHTIHHSSTLPFQE